MDNVCRRYNTLPSNLLRTGDMIDFIIADVGVGWESYVEQCRKQGIDPMIGRFGHKTEEELLAMVERAKNASNREQ